MPRTLIVAGLVVVAVVLGLLATGTRSAPPPQHQADAPTGTVRAPTPRHDDVRADLDSERRPAAPVRAPDDDAPAGHTPDESASEQREIRRAASKLRRRIAADFGIQIPDSELVLRPDIQELSATYGSLQKQRVREEQNRGHIAHRLAKSRFESGDHVVVDWDATAKQWKQNPMEPPENAGAYGAVLLDYDQERKVSVKKIAYFWPGDSPEIDASQRKLKRLREAMVSIIRSLGHEVR